EASVSQLNAIASATAGSVSTSVTTITGTSVGIQAIIDAGEITISNSAVNFDLDDTDVSEVSELTDLADTTTGSVTAAHIKDDHASITYLQNENATILNNATGKITADGTFAPETISLLKVEADLVINGFGFNDFILSGKGNDTITGGSGDDNILAGLGDDVIIMSDLANDNNGFDSLRSFTSSTDTLGVGEGSDTIQFSGSDLQGVTGFSQYTGAGNTVTGGGVTAEFLVGSNGIAADEEGATFIYNTSTGILSFDADGTGDEAKIDIAKLYEDTFSNNVIEDILGADLSII
ncbi:hypothetical protein N9D98_01605, partial [Amylibacter sp.]|nr:hypothetical protein [Amylibacter sp.]